MPLSVKLSSTIGDLKAEVDRKIKEESKFRMLRNVPLTVFKVYVADQAGKPTNIVINLGHDELILVDMDQTLAEAGIAAGTEISYFGGVEYERWRVDPVVKVWTGM
ncbi:uncharacterised protein family UPF0538 [Kipferlia bialata]|uniref:Ubiquitin-like domain-containing protein n=1 Tax=Kipferlia bialata TaxID=797122 RepID=A0A9K3CZC9_9EUKA|nr:uncharacterised protein family UPF0538 [Kipferlia bialata]|eukprot:g6279.t1